MRLSKFKGMVLFTLKRAQKLIEQKNTKSNYQQKQIIL